MPVKAKDRPDVFARYFGGKDPRSDLSFGDVDATAMRRLVVAVTSCGGLVSFSCASRGSTLVVSVLHDFVPDDARKTYFPPSCDLETEFLRLVDMWEAIAEEYSDGKPPTKAK